jgi:hypothetical protein
VVTEKQNRKGETVKKPGITEVCNKVVRRVDKADHFALLLMLQENHEME